MKIVKNLTVTVLAMSFSFAGIGFHMATNYSDMDEATIGVDTSYGVTYGLNSSASVGYDSKLGMLMYFAAPAGTTLRVGWTPGVGAANGTADNFATSTSMGIGYTWWSGGDGLKTSLTTNFDYVMAPGATDAAATQETKSTNLSVVVGFGF